MIIKKITSHELLTTVLIEVGVYLLQHDLGEVEVRSGELRVKAVIDLVEKEATHDD